MLLVANHLQQKADHAVQMTRCSVLLQKVEGRLGHFDVELNGVNREIRSLEEDSDQLSIMLRNRIVAADKLGAWLQNTTVPPALVNGVTTGDVQKGKLFSETLNAVRIKYSNMQAFAGHEHLPAFPTLQVCSLASANSSFASTAGQISSWWYRGSFRLHVNA